MSKTISALGVCNISENLFTFIKNNIKSTQDLFSFINKKLIPINLKKELMFVINKTLSKHITINSDQSIYPIRLSNYLFQISKETICMFGTKLGLLDVKLINEDIENKASITKSISNQYVRVKPVVKESSYVKVVKETDLSKLNYGSKEWFDAFYSDANWSVNDIKLGIN